MKDFDASAAYIRKQAEHHGVTVIDDRQHPLTRFTTEPDTAISAGVAEGRSGRGS